MNYATLAFEHSPAPMVVLSYRFIKECNAAFSDLFGYQQGELLNCSMRKLFPSTQDFEKIGNDALSGLTLQSGQTYSDQRFMLHATGEIFWTQTFGRTLTPKDPFEIAIWHFERKIQDASIAPCLTWRETQISQYVVNGLTCKEIAKILALSPRTVEAHKANLMKKLGVHSKSELASKIIVHSQANPLI